MYRNSLTLLNTVSYYSTRMLKHAPQSSMSTRRDVAAQTWKGGRPFIGTVYSPKPIVLNVVYAKYKLSPKLHSSLEYQLILTIQTYEMITNAMNTTPCSTSQGKECHIAIASWVRDIIQVLNNIHVHDLKPYVCQPLQRVVHIVLCRIVALHVTHVAPPHSVL